MIKSWIVYETADGKVDAIIDDFDTAALFVFNEKGVILGTPAFANKKDAIDYIISLPKRKPRLKV